MAAAMYGRVCCICRQTLTRFQKGLTSNLFEQKERGVSLPYFVRRTRNHMLPMYEEVRNGNTRKMVKVRNIDGDIWAFDADLREYLLKMTGKKIIASQVHEPGGYIRVKGQLAEHVCQFLLDKGF